MHTNKNIQIRIERVTDFDQKKKTYSVLIYKDNKLHDIIKSSESPEVLKYDVLHK